MNINQSWECVDRKKHGSLVFIALLVAFYCSLPLSNSAIAQGLCEGAPGGGFTLASPTICLGQSVSVITPATVKNALYAYIYTGSTNETAVAGTAIVNPTFQYTFPGSYTILQFGSNGATGTRACQVVTVAPTGKIDWSYKLCSSTTGNNAVVQLDVTLDAFTKTYDKILVNWGDGTPEQSFPMSAVNSITHTYAAVGDYVVRVKGGFNINQLCITQESMQAVPVRSRQKPYIPSLSSSGTAITIQAQGNTGEVIELLQKNGTTYQPTGLTLTGTGSFTVPSTQQTQCFKVRSTNGCGSVDESEEVCSLNLNAQTGNKQNDLSWQAYEGTGNFIRYQIKRSVNGGGSGQLANIANKTTTTYTDADNILCGSQYCYQMEATIFGASGQITVTSTQTCVTGSSGDVPGAMRNLTVSVEDDGQIRIRTVAPTTGTTTNFSIVVSRADSPSGPFQQIGVSTNNTIFFDKNASPNSQVYCYQVVYHNECGNDSPASKACSIFLTSTSTGVDWTPASPFDPGSVAEYTLEVYDAETGDHVKDIPMGGNTHYDPDPNDQSAQTFRYRIYAEYGPYSSTSNYYDFKRNASIFVPTAFTPNGDGQNDKFKAFGTFWEAFSMTIYTSWGEAVYSTNNKDDGWDGTLNGQPLPTGNYVYRIAIRDKDGQQIEKRGTVLLMR